MAGLGRRSHYRKHLTDSVLHDLPEPNYPYERIAQIVGSRGGNFFDILVSPPQSNTTPRKPDESQIDHEHVTKENFSSFQTSTTTNKLKPKHRLALLPTKFRKLVWVKRGDYVIVNCGDDNDEDYDEDYTVEKDSNGYNTSLVSNDEKKEEKDNKEKGVRYMIQHILYKDQIKHLQSKGLWPDVFVLHLSTDHSNYNINSIAEKGSLKKNSFVETSTSSVLYKGNTGNEYGENDENEDNNYLDGEYSHDYLNQDDLLMNANTNRMAHVSIYDDDDSEESSSDEESDEDQ